MGVDFLLWWKDRSPKLDMLARWNTGNGPDLGAIVYVFLEVWVTSKKGGDTKN